MFDFLSFVRVFAFGIIFAGIEYRYVNRREHEWTKTVEGFMEKPVFWVVQPYHLYLVLPLFAAASFTLPITAWAGNTFFLAVLEDVAYFAWRGKGVVRGEWTTTFFGSLNFGKVVIPVWWPLDLLVAGALFWVPF